MFTMHVITTIGPDNATNAVLPFIAAKGAMAEGENVELFLMQEATYLGSSWQLDLSELKAPGLPTVEEVLDTLKAEQAINEVVVCKPCADARGITVDDLRDGFEFGGAADLARQASRHDTTVTF